MILLVRQNGVHTPEGIRYDHPRRLLLSSMQQITEDAAHHCALNETHVVSFRQGDYWRVTFADGFFTDYHFPPPEQVACHA